MKGCAPIGSDPIARPHVHPHPHRDPRRQGLGFDQKGWRCRRARFPRRCSSVWRSSTARGPSEGAREGSSPCSGLFRCPPECSKSANSRDSPFARPAITCCQQGRRRRQEAQPHHGAGAPPNNFVGARMDPALSPFCSGRARRRGLIIACSAQILLIHLRHSRCPGCGRLVRRLEPAGRTTPSPDGPANGCSRPREPKSNGSLWLVGNEQRGRWVTDQVMANPAQNEFLKPIAAIKSHHHQIDI